MELREKGPIEIMCKEIGFAFDPRLENTEMLIGFVSVLVSHIASMRAMQVNIAEYIAGGKLPSADSEEVLHLTLEMLATNDYDSLPEKTAEIHNYIHAVAPDDAYPCDHLIDMLSSCVSAVRFGIEKPCHSRHAASAAEHVWSKLYGLKQFDRHTPNWKNDWTRNQLQEAILLRMLPASPTQPESGEGV